MIEGGTDTKVSGKSIPMPASITKKSILRQLLETVNPPPTVMKYKKESDGAYRNDFQNYILNQKTKNLSSISEMIIYIVYASMDQPLIKMLGDNIHLI